MHYVEPQLLPKLILMIDVVNRPAAVQMPRRVAGKKHLHRCLSSAFFTDLAASFSLLNIPTIDQIKILYYDA